MSKQKPFILIACLTIIILVTGCTSGVSSAVSSGESSNGMSMSKRSGIASYEPEAYDNKLNANLDPTHVVRG